MPAESSQEQLHTHEQAANLETPGFATSPSSLGVAPFLAMLCAFRETQDSSTGPNKIQIICKQPLEERRGGGVFATMSRRVLHSLA